MVIYIDILHNNSHDPQRKVIEELNNSNLLIVLDTENVKHSNWVKIELEKAKENNLKIIFLKPEDILETNFKLEGIELY